MLRYLRRNSAGFMCFILIAWGIPDCRLAKGSEPIDRRELAKPPFTTAVDWHKPPPGDLKMSSTSPVVPTELITGVLKPKREEATTLLGQADIISINATQTRDLAGLRDPDTILGSLITKKKDRLHFFQSHPAPAFAEKQHRDVIENLRREIAQYRAWRHRLKPYLIKAVALNLEGRGFNGTLVGKTLFVDQITPIHGKVPMKRMPVVGFLPLHPNKIYTTFTTFE